MQKTLTPYHIREEEKAYVSVRNIADRLAAKDVHNIAVTGAYGSGKSSVLFTLQKDFPQYDYLTISLATLDGIDEEYTKEEPYTKPHVDKEALQNQRIEYSILQQLIYRESQENLPNSRIKRILAVPEDKATYRTLLILIAILSLAGCIWNVEVSETMFRLGFGASILPVLIRLVCAIGILGSAYTIIHHVVKRTGRQSLRKVNVGSGEIELEDNTSVLNKHMDEIIYFFQSTPYNVVLIEDLDRFKTTLIFLKLRELNFLLNQSKEINRDIFFVYAVKDDLFCDEARTKFFEYITTVIPVSSHSNSYDQILQDLKERKLLPGFQQDHTGFVLGDLRDMCWYVKDKRLAINIVNEYDQYIRQLEDVHPYKMMAMMILKNLHPDLFSEMCQESGKVVEAIKLREAIIESRLKQTREDIGDLLAAQQKSKEEVLRNEVELRTIYVNEYRKRFNGYCNEISIDGNTYSWNTLCSDPQIFDLQKESPTITYRVYTTPYGGYTTQKFNLSFRDVESAVDANRTFAERLTAIHEQSRDFETELTEKRKQVTTVTAMSLSQLLTEDIRLHAGEKDYLSPIKSMNLPEMVETFLVRGFVDEHYCDFVVPFYGGYLTKKDHDLLMKMKMGVPIGFETKPEKVGSLVEQMADTLFGHYEAFNVDILDYLCKYRKNKSLGRKYKILLQALSDEKSLNFHCVYFNAVTRNDSVFRELIDEYHVDYRHFYAIADDEHKPIIAMIILRYWECDFGDDYSSEWVNHQFEFIAKHVDEIGWDVLDKIIQTHTYAFENLSATNEKWFKLVFGHGQYAINKHNVQCILEALGTDCSRGINYTMIRDLGDNVLLDKVDSNWNFVADAVLGGECSKEESHETILKILSKSEMPEAFKYSYLSDQRNKIEVDEWPTSIDINKALDMRIFEANWLNVERVYHLLGDEWSNGLINWVHTCVIKTVSTEMTSWMVGNVVSSCKEDGSIWNKEVLWHTLISEKDENNKLKLVNAIMTKSEFKIDDLPLLLSLLDNPLKDLFNGKRFVLVDNSDEMSKLLKYMTLWGYIIHTNPVQEKVRVYAKRKNN